MRNLLQRKLRYASVVFAVTIAVALMPLTAQAVLIDFESGFANLDPVGTVGIATFGVGPAGVPTGTGFIANVGAPQTAFVPNDTPNPATNAGSFFLTDETAGPSIARNYFIDFSVPVTSLSLDLYDYRVDGGPAIGDTATLTVFSDAARTIPVGSDTFTIPSPNPVDGNVVSLSISAAPSPILAASLIFSTGDVGTGIDNINFAPVPEPSTLLLLGLGLAGAGFVSGGRGRRKEMQ